MMQKLFLPVTPSVPLLGTNASLAAKENKSAKDKWFYERKQVGHWAKDFSSATLHQRRKGNQAMWLSETPALIPASRVPQFLTFRRIWELFSGTWSLSSLGQLSLVKQTGNDLFVEASFFFSLSCLWTIQLKRRALLHKLDLDKARKLYSLEWMKVSHHINI